MRKNRFPILFLSFLFLILSSSAFAAGDEVVSINDGLQLFYKNNYDIIINKHEVDKSYADYIAARLLPNPTLTTNIIGLQYTGGLTGDNTQLSVRLDQLFELGGKRGFRTKYANEVVEAAELSHKDTIRTLLAGFYNLFYGINLDMLNIDEAKEELKRFDKTLDVAEKRYKSGFLTLVDYTKLKVARVDMENNVTNLENQAKNDLEQFDLILGTTKPLRPAAVPLMEAGIDVDEDVLLNAAYQSRYDYLSIQKQIKASEYNVSLAKAGRVPDVTLGAEYDGFGSNLEPAFGVGMSVSIPIFNRNQGEISRRKAENIQTEAQMDKVKGQVIADVRTGMNNYRASQKVFDAYKGKKDEVEDLMTKSEKAFSLGGITVLDLLDTRKMVRDFEFKYNQALVQANLSRELLKVYTGEIVKTGDVK